MIRGCFGVCEKCGGEINVVSHLIDAHMAEQGTGGDVHLVWAHVACNESGETPISVQDYKSALSHARLGAGSQVEVIASEADELYDEFVAQLEDVRTVADLEKAWA